MRAQTQESECLGSNLSSTAYKAKDFVKLGSLSSVSLSARWECLSYLSHRVGVRNICYSNKVHRSINAWHTVLCKSLLVLLLLVILCS